MYFKANLSYYILTYIICLENNTFVLLKKHFETYLYAYFKSINCNLSYQLRKTYPLKYFNTKIYEEKLKIFKNCNKFNLSYSSLGLHTYSHFKLQACTSARN